MTHSRVILSISFGYLVDFPDPSLTILLCQMLGICYLLIPLDLSDSALHVKVSSKLITLHY